MDTLDKGDKQELESVMAGAEVWALVSVVVMAAAEVEELAEVWAVELGDRQSCKEHNDFDHQDSPRSDQLQYTKQDTQNSLHHCKNQSRVEYCCCSFHS